MGIKTYNLQNGWFSITLPDEWDEEEDAGTFCFFNAKKWTGNLRITPFHWPNIVGADENKSAQYITEEIKENEGAIRTTLGDFDSAYYKKHISEDGEELVIHYWTAGKNNDIFICSFTTDEAIENQTELNLVQEIISSII